MAKFTEMAVVKLTDLMDLVISRNDEGGFSIVKRARHIDGPRETFFFIKDPIRVESLDGLRAIQAAFNEAVERAEKII